MIDFSYEGNAHLHICFHCSFAEIITAHSQIYSYVEHLELQSFLKFFLFVKYSDNLVDIRLNLLYINNN